MRRVALVIALLGSLASGAAQADPGHLGGMGANLFGNSFFNFGQPNLERLPVATIGLGKLSMQLQRTRLADVQRVYGGTVYEEAHGGSTARWLCYQSPTAATWLMSNSLGGGEFIMMVAEQAGAAEGSCDTAPAGFSGAELGIPGLGAGLADLKARFGGAAPGRRGEVTYRADTPAKDGLRTANDAQYIGYVLKGGRVVGVGVGATTTQ